MPKYSEDYKQGYIQALNDLNNFKMVIQEKWNPSKCPNCEKSFSDYEPCNDGYYKRATNLMRCPYCGQAIYWDELELDYWKRYYPNYFRQVSIKDIFKE